MTRHRRRHLEMMTFPENPQATILTIRVQVKTKRGHGNLIINKPEPEENHAKPITLSAKPITLSACPNNF